MRSRPPKRWPPGRGLSLDDFGTGYSNLVRLKRLPVTEVKIDSSFVGRILESPDDEVVVKSILDLAAALGIRSVAEGVESEAVSAALLAMGCVAAQGWHFAKPMNAASATAWLTDHATKGERAQREEQAGAASRSRPAARVGHAAALRLVIAALPAVSPSRRRGRAPVRRPGV